jgi:hypothetical protein
MSAQGSSEILHAIGTVAFERRSDGSFLVRCPVEGRTVFGPNEEKEAREYFQSVARAEKGYPSGFDPFDPSRNGNAPGEAARPLNAARVRKAIGKDSISIGDFLELCTIELGVLFAFIDEAEGSPKDKARLKEKIRAVAGEEG